MKVGPILFVGAIGVVLSGCVTHEPPPPPRPIIYHPQPVYVVPGRPVIVEPGHDHDRPHHPPVIVREPAPKHGPVIKPGPAQGQHPGKTPVPQKPLPQRKGQVPKPDDKDAQPHP